MAAKTIILCCQSLMTHSEQYLKSNNLPFVCDICGKNIPYPETDSNDNHTCLKSSDAIATLHRLVTYACRTIGYHIEQSVKKDNYDFDKIEITSLPWCISVEMPVFGKGSCYIGVNERDVAECTLTDNLQLTDLEILYDNITPDQLASIGINRKNGLITIENIVKAAVTPFLQKPSDTH